MDTFSVSDELHEIADQFYPGAIKKRLIALACRIDAEMAELPRGKDGVPIHVGDTVYGYGKTIEVVEMRYGRGGWVLISRDGSGYADTFAFTHRHAPTVEDVLREFAEKITDSQIPGVHPTYEESIAEYAAKLRLAGDAE